MVSWSQELIPRNVRQYLYGIIIHLSVTILSPGGYSHIFCFAIQCRMLQSMLKTRNCFVQNSYVSGGVQPEEEVQSDISN